MAKDDKKTISDVAKPGSVAPDSSAKPIIVSHKPMIKDPMVQDDAKDPEIEKKEELKSVPSDSGKVIEPISSDDSPKEEKKEDEPKRPEEADSKPLESDDNAVVDAVLSQSDQKNKKSKEDAELAEHEAINSKLIESKKYFVKIKQPKRKRNKRLLLTTVVIFILGFVGVGAAADADLLPLEVPFDFIKSSSVVEEKVEPTNTNTDTVAQPQKTEADMKREADIKMLHGSLEMYYQQEADITKRSYPLLEELNDEAFMNEHFTDVVKMKVQDPDAKDSKFVDAPVEGVYSYQPSGADDAACDNIAVLCTNYVLTATLSDGTTYIKESLGSSSSSAE